MKESDQKIQSSLVSRNVTISGKRTSVRLEPEMWVALKDIAKREQCTIHDICTLIQLRKNENTSLTAAVRVFIMLYFRAASTEEGHKKAGHGSLDKMKVRAGVKLEKRYDTGRENDDNAIIFRVLDDSFERQKMAG